MSTDMYKVTTTGLPLCNHVAEHACSQADQPTRSPAPMLLPWTVNLLDRLDSIVVTRVTKETNWSFLL